MSFVFPVSEAKYRTLLERMKSLGVKESDLNETFTRASGNGGQNVNKVSTAVHLKHPSSGLEVKCSIHRTQGLNRYKARVLLCDKLEDKYKPENSPRIKTIDKIRKNKALKTKRQKQKRLAELNKQEIRTYEED
jgi:peptide chain release factor